MTVVEVVLFIALALAAVAQFEARGRSLLGWSVILTVVALLYGSLS